MLTRTISAAVVALALATLAHSAIVMETADAGDSLATASSISIADPTEIIGTLATTTDADLYELTLALGMPFRASTSSSGPFGIFDTQLFLFDATGNGVRYNDDVTTTDFFSRIDFLPSVGSLLPRHLRGRLSSNECGRRLSLSSRFVRCDCPAWRLRGRAASRMAIR